jgi:hypothetical protein
VVYDDQGTQITIAADAGRYIRLDERLFQGCGCLAFAADGHVSGVTGRCSASMQLNQNGTTSATLMNIGDNPTGGSIDGAPPAAYSGRYVSGPFMVQADCTSVRARMSAKDTTGASGVIRFGNPYLAVIT